jgi:hypothetical protein
VITRSTGRWTREVDLGKKRQGLIIVRMPPIVAMAPAVPTYRPTLIDRVGVILRGCTPPVRMSPS